MAHPVPSLMPANPRPDLPVSAFKPQQRHLTIGDRAFHFVAYEGHPANPQRDIEELPATWYLMVEGRRCAIMEYDPAQPLEEVDEVLWAWVEDNALVPGEVAETAPTAKTGGTNRPNQNWWGPS